MLFYVIIETMINKQVFVNIMNVILCYYRKTSMFTNIISSINSHPYFLQFYFLPTEASAFATGTSTNIVTLLPLVALLLQPLSIVACKPQASILLKVDLSVCPETYYYYYLLLLLLTTTTTTTQIGHRYYMLLTPHRY